MSGNDEKRTLLSGGLNDPPLLKEGPEETDIDAVRSSEPLIDKEHHSDDAHKKLCRLKFAAASGVVVAIVSVVMRILLPTIVDDIVWKETAISSRSSTLYKAWLNPATEGVNIYRSYTFYNLTNPFDVANGAPPNFIEKGPYTFSEIRAKIDDSVEWYDNGTVGYTYSSSYIFAPELSKDAITGEQLHHDDVMLLLNAPLTGLTHRLSRVPSVLGHTTIDGFTINITKEECCILLDLMLNATVGPQGIFVHRSVKEFLWGYEDPIWAAVHPELTNLNYTASKIFQSEWNGTYVVPSPYSFRSGQMCPLWENIDACNTTMNLYTLEGSGTLRDGAVSQGHIDQWAGQRRLWWWGAEQDSYTGGMEVRPRPTRGVPDYNIVDNDPCHAVHGSDGFRFGPHITKQSQPQLFLDMLWRSVPLSYWEEGSVKDIPTLKFSLSEPVMDNASETNKKCYHMNQYGVLNFSKPLYGPAFATKARLLDAKVTKSDVNYTLQRPICVNESAAGVCTNWTLSPPLNVLDYLEVYYQRESNPDVFRTKYESHLNINALTGITLSGVAQGEAMTLLRPVEVGGCPGLFASAALLPRTYFPLISVRRGTEVSDKYATKLREALTMLTAVTYAIYVVMGLGALLFVWSVYMHRKLTMK